MSESANGGDVDFVRLYVPELKCWVERCSADGVREVALTDSQAEAGIFISPSLDMLRAIAGFFGGVSTQPATFEDWINQSKAAQ